MGDRGGKTENPFRFCRFKRGQMNGLRRDNLQLPSERAPFSDFYSGGTTTVPRKTKVTFRHSRIARGLQFEYAF
jgi:hypothetical protein